MFIAALFTIAKSCKQHVSITDAWIKKMWYARTVEYYSAIKKERFGRMALKLVKYHV